MPVLGIWRVEEVDTDNDGTCYITDFGCHAAEERARLFYQSRLQIKRNKAKE